MWYKLIIILLLLFVTGMYIVHMDTVQHIVYKYVHIVVLCINNKFLIGIYFNKLIYKQTYICIQKVNLLY